MIRVLNLIRGLEDSSVPAAETKAQRSSGSFSLTLGFTQDSDSLGKLGPREKLPPTGESGGEEARRGKGAVTALSTSQKGEARPPPASSLTSSPPLAPSFVNPPGRLCCCLRGRERAAPRELGGCVARARPRQIKRAGGARALCEPLGS